MYSYLKCIVYDKLLKPRQSYIYMPLKKMEVLLEAHRKFLYILYDSHY